MRKTTSCILAGLAVSLLVVGFAAAAAPADKGSPFDALWAAIAELGTRIDTIQLTPGPQGPPGPAGADGSVVKIVTGKAYNDDTVDVPEGYTIEQCTMVVYADEITHYNVNAQTPPYQQITYITDSFPLDSGFRVINHVRIVWSGSGDQTYAPYQMAADYLMICIK